MSPWVYSSRLGGAGKTELEAVQRICKEQVLIERRLTDVLRDMDSKAASCFSLPCIASCVCCCPVYPAYPGSQEEGRRILTPGWLQC